MDRKKVTPVLISRFFSWLKKELELFWLQFLLHFFLVILIKVHLELDKFFHILKELKEGGSGFKFLAALG